jgi:hypothetical protein
MLEGDDGRDAIEHPEAEGQADDRDTESIGGFHPDGREPPADEDEVEGANEDVELLDRDFLAVGLVAIAGDGDAVGFIAEGNDPGKLVEHDESNGDADNSEDQEPGDGDPGLAEPPADEGEPEELQEAARITTGFDYGCVHFSPHDDIRRRWWMVAGKREYHREDAKDAKKEKRNTKKNRRNIFKPRKTQKIRKLRIAPPLRCAAGMLRFAPRSL